MTNPSVCVFCGSRAGSKPEYSDLAARVGRRLAENGAELVYGGGMLGLMGVVSDAALAAGGRVTGIIPTFLQRVEVQHPNLTRTIVTRGMLDRKQAMFDLSDGFLALPGGIGTLDEVLEVMTWRQLQQIDRPLILLSEDGFWQPFVSALDHTVAEEFAADSIHSLYQVETDLDAALAALGIG